MGVENGVKIGLWSYSLYLWHWVILAGFRYVFVQNDLPLIAILLAAVMTFLFSYLSYEHIEKPARKASLSHHQFVYGMTAYFLGASCFAMIMMHHKDLIDDVQINDYLAGIKISAIVDYNQIPNVFKEIYKIKKFCQQF